MNQSKSKSKKLSKGLALGFATMISTTALPVGSMVALAETWKDAQISSNTNRIEVDKSENSKSYVTKGATVTIPQGVYYGKTSTSHIIGGSAQTESLKSKVYVTYSNGDEVEVRDNKFVAERIGSYKITYSVVDGTELYTYDTTVICEASEAEFEFKSNDENIIPSIYDVAIAGEKDIVLPLPSISNADDEEILSSDASNFTTTLSAPEGKNSFVMISITNGSDDIKVVKEDGKFVIKTTDDGHITSALKGREYTINYSYYEKNEDKNIFVSSTTKTFTVKDGYYKKSSKENAEKGYDLVASLSTKPDSSIVGVEKDLPTLTATTKSENSPSSESVDVYYTIKAYRKDGSEATGVITEDGKFKADKEDDFTIEFTAHDFYGNEYKSEKTSFTIKAKDTQSPDVYMYDAGLRTQEEKENGTYRSAETSLKSKTINRNIVMYAIGGKDNMVADEDVVLRREIWDGSYYKRFIIKEQAYNDYNLIFAPQGGETTDVYKQIVNDNYEIYRQMIVDSDPDADVTDSAKIQAWLKKNHYLLVSTTFNKGINGETIVDEEGFTEESDNVAQKMIENGYAYVKPEVKDYTFSTSDTYTFYYYAKEKDEVNNNNNKEKSISYSVQVAATMTDDTSTPYTDESAPTITFPTDLQSSYLPTDTITFKTITSSNVADNGVDTRPVIRTAYRFLKLDGTGNRVPAENDGAEGTQTLTYVVKGNTNKKDENKYYYTEAKANNDTFSQGGWHFDDEAQSYKIELSKAVEKGAQYVEILAYAIDDYGNIGFYNKVISIASVDEIAPTLTKVSNISTDETYQAPDKITLPTLQYSDDRVGGISARVDLYKLEGSGENTTKQKLPTSGMMTSYDENAGVFTLDAGYFNASSAGDYQVVVTVIDSSNHSISTYFKYHVVGQTLVEAPEISNISTETKEVELGKNLYLPTPTLAISESEDYGYIGIGDDDDSNNATNYFPQVVDSTSSDYELTKYYFKGNTEGTYKIQYNVFVIRYNKDESSFAQTKTNGKLYFKEGSLVYVAEDGDEYYVNIAKDSDGEYIIEGNSQKDGLGDEIEGNDKKEMNKLVSLYALQSKTVTVSVKEAVIDVTMPDDAYAKTDYPVISDDSRIEIIKPDVSVRGSYEINKDASTVKIVYSSNSDSNDPLATITFAEWENAISGDTTGDFTVEGKKIYLNLKKHGQYKITYSIQAQNQYGENVGDPKTLDYTIRSGDNTQPTFEIKKNAITTAYSLDDTMTISFKSATISDMFALEDNNTSVEDLLKTLKVTLKGPSKTETLENKAESDFEYTYTFEEAGEYTLTFQVTDKAGNTSSDKVSFTVKAKENKAIDVKKVAGGVLIGVSLALLGGVVVYFIVSKVKLDKKERSYKKK